MKSTLHQFDAAYTRYSSHNQDDGTTIEVQLEKCRTAAGGPVREYIDAARTGRNIGGRQHFKRLLADIEAGLIRHVFVYKHDLLAKYYSEVLAERTRDGLIKRFEQGGFTGGIPPFGFKVVKSPEGKPQYAINPGEAEEVKWLVSAFLAEPVGVKALARRLQHRGVPTRKDGPWTFTTVWAILLNPMLTDEVKYNRRRMKLDEEMGNRLPRFKDESEHGTRRDENLRIIADTEFAAVPAKILLRRKPKGAAKAVNGIRPFTGHLFCQSCGSVFYAKTSKNRKGEYHFYGCGSRQRNGVAACPHSVSVQEDKLLEAVVNTHNDLLAVADSLITGAVAEGRRHLDAGRGESARIRQMVSKTEEEVTSLIRLTVRPPDRGDRQEGDLGASGSGAGESRKATGAARSDRGGRAWR